MKTLKNPLFSLAILSIGLAFSSLASAQTADSPKIEPKIIEDKEIVLKIPKEAVTVNADGTYTIKLDPEMLKGLAGPFNFDDKMPNDGQFQFFIDDEDFKGMPGNNLMQFQGLKNDDKNVKIIVLHRGNSRNSLGNGFNGLPFAQGAGARIIIIPMGR